MKVAEGRVVKGAIVTRARFKDGARVTVIEHDDRAPVKLSKGEAEDVLQGLADVEAGRTLPVEKLRSRLRALRSKK